MYNQNNPYSPYNQNNSPFALLLRLFSLIAGLILLLVAVGLLIYLLTLSEPFIPNLAAGDFSLEAFKPLLIAVLAGLAGLWGIMLVIGPRGRRAAGRIIRGVYTVAIVLAMGAALFWSYFINPNVGMTRTSFARTSVSITEGDTLHFQNPADGVTQILCIGVDQHCETDERAPDVLNKGIKVAPGQTVDVTFMEAGALTITSQSTPHMNIKIKINTYHSSTSSHRRH